jgi:hypothetical protein
VISTIDDNNLSLLSSVGLPSNDPPKQSYFKSLPASKDILIVSDISRDNRFHSHKFTTETDKIRFYVSLKLISNQVPIGILALMDSESRTSFSPENQLAFTEICQILTDLLVESSSLPAVTNSPKISMDKRLLHLLKLPLRNITFLQKQLHEFHGFLNQKGPNNKAQPEIAKDNHQKIEIYRKEINEKKELIEKSLEISFLSLMSLKETFQQYTSRFVDAASPNRIAYVRYISVKEWIKSITSYLSYLKLPSLLSQITWNYDESEYLEIEEENNFEILGKLVEFLLLTTFHKWKCIVINISVSDDGETQLLKEKTKAVKTSSPFSDEITHLEQSRSAGRIHIDIQWNSPLPHITHLNDEFHFLQRCDEFVYQVIYFLSGSTNKTTNKKNKTNDSKNLWFPCTIREKKHSSGENRHDRVGNRVKTPYAGKRGSGKSGKGSSKKTDPLSPSSNPRSPNSELISPLSEKVTRPRGKRFSVFFNDDDDADAEDLRMLYSDSEDENNNTTGAVDGRREPAKQAMNLYHINSLSDSEDDEGDVKVMRKELSLGEFKSSMVHVKRNNLEFFNVHHTNTTPTVSSSSNSTKVPRYQQHHHIPTAAASYDEYSEMETSQKTYGGDDLSMKSVKSNKSTKKPLPSNGKSSFTSSIMKYLPTTVSFPTEIILFRREKNKTSTPPSQHVNSINSVNNAQPKKSQSSPPENSSFLSYFSNMFGGSSNQAPPNPPKNSNNKKKTGFFSKRSSKNNTKKKMIRNYRQTKVVPVQKRS